MTSQYDVEPLSTISEPPPCSKPPTSLGFVGLRNCSDLFLTPSRLWIFRSARLVLCVLRYLLGFFYGVQGFFLWMTSLIPFLVSVRFGQHPRDEIRHSR